MTQITLAEIPYLNCAPFYWDKGLEFPGTEFLWVLAHPKDLGEGIRKGEIDGGPVSLLDSLDLEGFQDLPFGICAKGSAQSVLLFSREPVPSLSGRVIGLTDQSATSAELLKILLRERYRMDPRFESGLNPGDSARLLIGNQALAALMDPFWQRSFPYRMDLGEEWRRWTGLPFVFARWMLKKSVSASLRSAIEGWISGNLEFYQAYSGRVIEQFERERGWKIPEAEKYLAGFNFTLGDQEKKSIETFRGFLKIPAVT